jgi:hypothetical protein
MYPLNPSPWLESWLTLVTSMQSGSAWAEPSGRSLVQASAIRFIESAEEPSRVNSIHWFCAIWWVGTSPRNSGGARMWM